MNIDFPNYLQRRWDSSGFHRPTFAAVTPHTRTTTMCAPRNFPITSQSAVNQKVRYNLKVIYLYEKSSTTLQHGACQPWSGPVQGAHADFVAGTGRIVRLVLRHFVFVVDMQSLQLPFTRWPEELITNAIEHCSGNTRHRCVAEKDESIDTRADMILPALHSLQSIGGTSASCLHFIVRLSPRTSSF
jgi:hypothetical protein